MELITKVASQTMKKGQVLGKKSSGITKVKKITKIKRTTKIKNIPKAKIIYTVEISEEDGSDEIRKKFTNLDEAKDWLILRIQGYDEGSIGFIEFSNDINKFLSLQQEGEGKYAMYYWEDERGNLKEDKKRSY